MPQQALPVEAIEYLNRGWGDSPLPGRQVSAALCTLAFFFLLRVGEYTPHGAAVRRTVPLRKGDVRLWIGHDPVDAEAPLDTLLRADGATIKIDNQKNGVRGATLHHHSSGDPSTCPVRAAAILLDRVRGMARDTPIGTFRDPAGNLRQITAKDIRAALKLAASETGLQARGFALDRIGSHSLRSGGAMALKLAGFDSDVIKKLGRWSSDTYLRYIQTQIAHLTHDVAHRMRNSLRFHVVG